MEIQPVHSQGDRPWDFCRRNDAKAETPVLWPSHVKSWLIGKGSDAGRQWGQEEKGTTEDEMAGWHHRLHGHEFEWTPGDGNGQGGLACCDSWGHKESDTTERLNWTELLSHEAHNLLGRIHNFKSNHHKGDVQDPPWRHKARAPDPPQRRGGVGQVRCSEGAPEEVTYMLRHLIRGSQLNQTQCPLCYKNL